MRYSIHPHKLFFKEPAGTSRGVYRTHDVWYIKLYCGNNPEYAGIGECAPLIDLSCDALPGYADILDEACGKAVASQTIDYESLRQYPSILFGLETAFRHYQAGSYRLYDTPFSRGEEGIRINGLIWMGNRKEMQNRIREKLDAGFHCLKLKIGAIDFEEELALIKEIRRHFTINDMEIRVDANGGFTPDNALDRLYRLAEYDIHSIEQPIQARQWQEMALLCEKTPLPIALDEELIGINDTAEKKRLLETIRPQYIILKPTLHGGIKGSEEWIALAEKNSAKWWITSALESNVALNMIAQWTASLGVGNPQGLGTGGLYTNNIESPLCIKGEYLFYNTKKTFARLC